jgi:heme A synthase
MKSPTTKSLLLAGALTCSAATACVAQMYSGYWVVGNGATHTCEIVTSNPVIDYNVGSFGSGPYQSPDDARLARSTIGACPKEDPASAGYRVPDEAADDDPN